MTFRQMEIFIAVSKYNSINKAAEALVISQQSASKSLQLLEEELGCQLLLRSPSGARLTEKGYYILREFNEILQKRDALNSGVQDLPSDRRAPLLVGMSYGVLSALPAEILPSFSEAHPDTELFFQDYTDAVLQEKLVRGEVDIALLAGPVSLDNVLSEPVKTEAVYLCIPKKHPLYHRCILTMRSLEPYAFIMFSDQYNIRYNFLKSCRQAGFTPQILLSSSDFHSLKELSIQTQSLMIAPEHTVPPHDPYMRYVRFPDERFIWEVTFSVYQGLKQKQNSTIFYEYLREKISEHAAQALAQDSSSFRICC